MNPDGLQIDHDVAYHRRFWKVQRVGWFCWALILVAAFTGFFGSGVVGKETLDDRDAGMSLTYQRLVRANAPAELRIELQSTLGQELKLALNRESIEAIDLNSIQPEPVEAAATESELVYTFKKVDAKQPMVVLFRYKPKSSGEIPFQIRLDNSAALFIKQFCFP